MFAKKMVHALYTIEILCSPVLDQNCFLMQFSPTARILCVCVCEPTLLLLNYLTHFHKIWYLFCAITRTIFYGPYL